MALPGDLIEYLVQKRMICALVMRTDRKNTLYVRTQDNREDKVAASKVIFRAPIGVTPDHEPEEVARVLREAAEERERIAAEIPLDELWELLIDEHAEELLELEALTELYFGKNATAEQLSGLYRSLNSDKTWFQRKGNAYKLRARDQVDDILTRVQVEEERARERGEIGRWLKDLWDSPRPNGRAPIPAGAEEAAERYLTWLRDVALFGPEAARFKEVHKLLKALEISRKDAPFRLLVKAGVWSEHENLLIHRFRTPVEFSPEIVAEAEAAAATLPQKLADAGRLDLRHLECFTIDDEDTTEIDDALSLERTEDGYRVGVHIADASSFVQEGTALDLEARERGTAIYLPTGKIRMLPESLGDDACSLLSEADRAAFSFLVDIGDDFSYRGYRMASAAIRVRRRLTYPEADLELVARPELAPLLQIAQALREKREREGAITVPFPRTTVRVDADLAIRVERESPAAPSQVVVSEMMILANRVAGGYLAEHGAPALFRSQPPPDKEIPAGTVFTPEVLYRLRRHFRKGELGLKPSRHSGLGLDAYIQVTSPIRRYSDLVMQRQLRSLLATGTPLYAEQDLEQLMPVLQRTMTQADLMEREQKAYWTLRYLEDQRWQELDAVVLQNLADKHIVQIVPVLWETDCPVIKGHRLPPGSPLKVRIELVWPRDRLVRVTPLLVDD
ncbi:MAG: RNB domain-containing ribonuclease [Armatimonadetes bacterium]|nr:RNB domain-containing ribonuclease [Armatimonadota bacterium]